MKRSEPIKPKHQPPKELEPLPAHRADEHDQKTRWWLEMDRRFFADFAPFAKVVNWWLSAEPGSRWRLQEVREHLRSGVGGDIGRSYAIFHNQARIGTLEIIKGHRYSAEQAILSSPRHRSVMNMRDKHLAHSLTETRREKEGPVEPMKYGDETALLKDSIPIIESLFCWVNGKSFLISESQRIDHENAEALWHGCKFDVLR